MARDRALEGETDKDTIDKGDGDVYLDVEGEEGRTYVGEQRLVLPSYRAPIVIFLNHFLDRIWI